MENKAEIKAQDNYAKKRIQFIGINVLIALSAIIFLAYMYLRIYDNEKLRIHEELNKGLYNYRQNVLSLVESESQGLNYLSSLVKHEIIKGHDEKNIYVALRLFCKEYNLDYVSYVMPNGEFYTNYKNTHDISNTVLKRNEIKRGFLGKSTLSFFFAVNEEGNFFSISVPIMEKDKVVAVASSYYKVSTLRKKLNLTSQISGSYPLSIVSSSGTVAYISEAGQCLFAENFQRSSLPYRDYTLFELLRMKHLSNKMINKVKKDMSEQKEGFFTISIEEDSRLMQYIPLEIDDWYIFSNVSSNLITLAVKKLAKEFFYLSLFLSVIFMFYVGYIICHEKRLRNTIESERDKLRVKEEELSIALKQSENEVFHYDFRNKVCEISEKISKELHITSVMENFPESLIRTGLIGQESAEDLRQFCKKIENGSKSESVLLKMYEINKKTVWVKLTSTVLFNRDGEPLYAIINSRDETELYESKLSYNLWQKYIKELSKGDYKIAEYNITKGIIETSSGNLEINLPEVDKDPNLEASITLWIEKNIYEDDKQRLRDFLSKEKLIADFRGKSYKTNEIEVRRKITEDEYRWTTISVKLATSSNMEEIKALVALRDIDKDKRYRIELEEKSRKDFLTGFLNRATFTDEINMKLAEESTSKHVFAIIDLNDFKFINDTYGHQTGDHVIEEVATKLMKKIRDYDLVGRLGGDEFVILLSDIPDIEMFKERVATLKGMTEVTVSDNLVITSSMGVSVYPDNGLTFEELYRKADLALYQAKKDTRGNLKFYDDTMEMTEDFEGNEITPIE
ncbi:MAG: GGDEF domain-containing protein [Synergistaceae bacterium]